MRPIGSGLCPREGDADPEEFGDAPCLGGASAGLLGFAWGVVAVVDLGDLAAAAGVERCERGGEELLRIGDGFV